MIHLYGLTHYVSFILIHSDLLLFDKSSKDIHTVSNTIQTMINIWCISSYVVFLVLLFMLVPSADGISCSSVGERARSAVQNRSLYIIFMCLILFFQKEQPQLSYWRRTAVRKRRSVWTISMSLVLTIQEEHTVWLKRSSTICIELFTNKQNTI